MKKTRTVTELFDDIDGSAEATTVRFGFDGKDYEIELAEKNAAKLSKALTPFIEQARPVRAERKPRKVAASTAPKAAVVRAWAAENGREVSSTGKISQLVIEEYLNADHA